jgi:dynein heavy chain
MNVVNFEVKQSGLEEQVLGIVLKVFDEKIEQQRIECINIKARCHKTLFELEEKILSMLQSQRNVLLFDDIELIGTL